MPPGLAGIQPTQLRCGAGTTTYSPTLMSSILFNPSEVWISVPAGSSPDDRYGMKPGTSWWTGASST